MSQEELESGKQTVEQLLKHLCAESGVTLGSPVVWHKDFDHDRYWLEVEFEGRSVKWPLSFEQLEDSVADKSVRRKIESGLRRFVVPTGEGTRSEDQSKTERIELQEATEADVFISHATEDKPYVEPLVKALEAAGISRMTCTSRVASCAQKTLSLHFRKYWQSASATVHEGVPQIQ